MRVTITTVAVAVLATFAAACSDQVPVTSPESGPAFATTAAAAGTSVTVYGLTSEGELITFDAAHPNKTTSARPVTGLTNGDRLVGLDFRASGPIATIGTLYALASGPNGGALYVVDRATGAASTRVELRTAAGARVILRGTAFGVGFNPVVDRLRVHSDAEQNLRINVASGLTIIDPALGFLSADVNAGTDAAVGGAAYTNSDNDPMTGTELYAIDAARDVLVEFPAPGGANGGQMLTVGALGVDTDTAIGFDIVGTMNGTAYAVLSESPSGKSTLYSIDLDTGRATRVGLLAQTKSYLVSVAVAP
ncbi:DUF4394 domain-containing protein [Gemmatimonas sp.]|uniref:DUF4394 domain-containing protein n=1 Tax=Gemmatimonas sp. TaxID=1962908 RepID=UPI0039839C44